MGSSFQSLLKPVAAPNVWPLAVNPAKETTSLYTSPVVEDPSPYEMANLAPGTSDDVDESDELYLWCGAHASDVQAALGTHRSADLNAMERFDELEFSL